MLQHRTLPTRGALLRRLAPSLLPHAAAAVRAHWEATGGAEGVMRPAEELELRAPAAARATPLHLLQGALLAATEGGREA